MHSNAIWENMEAGWMFQDVNYTESEKNKTKLFKIEKTQKTE